jgi:hypothetical protein
MGRTQRAAPQCRYAREDSGFSSDLPDRVSQGRLRMDFLPVARLYRCKAVSQASSGLAAMRLGRLSMSPAKMALPARRAATAPA